jgi:hypothetical protein
VDVPFAGAFGVQKASAEEAARPQTHGAEVAPKQPRAAIPHRPVRLSR